MWRLQEQLESLAVGVQKCVRQLWQLGTVAAGLSWSSVRRRLRRMKQGGCRISPVRRLLEQLESLAVGVACSSTG
jgi:hypothetical protein